MFNNIIKNISKKIITSSYEVVLIIFVSFIAIYNFFIINNLQVEHIFFDKIPTKIIAIDIITIVIILFYLIINYRNVFFTRVKSFKLKFQTKIILIIGALSIIPIIITFISAILFFNNNSKYWFDKLVNKSLYSSVEISEIYIKESKKDIVKDLKALKRFTEKRFKKVLLDSNSFEKEFIAKVKDFSIKEAVILLRGKKRNSLLAKNLPRISTKITKFDIKKNFHPNRTGYDVKYEEGSNYIKAITKISNLKNTYIIVGKPISEKIISYLEENKKAINGYNGIKSKIKRGQKQLSAIFALIITLLALIVLLFVINIYEKIFLPLINIALTKEEDKKDILEVILGNQAIAIIVFDMNHKIKLYNRSAQQLFKNKILAKKNITELIPEIENIIESFHKTSDDIYKTTINIIIEEKTTKVKIYLSLKKKECGYIMNFVL